MVGGGGNRKEPDVIPETLLDVIPLDVIPETLLDVIPLDGIRATKSCQNRWEFWSN